MKRKFRPLAAGFFIGMHALGFHCLFDGVEKGSLPIAVLGLMIVTSPSHLWPEWTVES